MADDIFYYGKVDVADARLNKLKRVLTSAFLFLSAYIIANMVHQFVVGMLGWIFGYHVKIGFHYVSAAPYDYASWSGPRVLFIYGTPPLICLTLAYAIYLIALRNTDVINRGRLFLFWLQACLINAFLTQLFIIPMGASPRYATGFYQTFSIVATWFKIPTSLFFVTTIVAAVLAMLWGFLAAPEIQRFSFSSKLVQTVGGKNKIALQVYLLPILIAMPAVVWFSNMLSFLLHILLLLLFILPWLGIFIRHRIDMGIVRCNKADVLNQWPVIELGLVLLTWTVTLMFFDK